MPYNKDRDDVVYHECFENASEGHALYKPFSALELKPGMCGYFNHSGDWRTIQDLTDRDAVVSNGWKPAGDIIVSPDPGSDTWPVVMSRGMVKFPMKVEGNVNIPKTPATFGFKIGYESERTYGAVLVTEGDVTHYQVDPRSSTKAKDWFISNAPKILDDYDTTKEKGIWVITSTYAVKRRAHALLHSKETSVSFEINVELQGAGKIAPSVGWWRSLESETWKDHKNLDGVVVFMTGWYWRPSLMSRKPKPTEKIQEQKKFLGHGDKKGVLEFQFSSSEAIQTVTLRPEKVGEFNEE